MQNTIRFDRLRARESYHYIVNENVQNLNQSTYYYVFFVNSTRVPFYPKRIQIHTRSVRCTSPLENSTVQIARHMRSSYYPIVVSRRLLSLRAGFIHPTGTRVLNRYSIVGLLRTLSYHPDTMVYDPRIENYCFLVSVILHARCILCETQQSTFYTS